MSYPSTKLRRANIRNKCNVCGGTGCAIGAGVTLCWRTKSQAQAKSGAWVHRDAQAYYNVQPVAAPVLVADLDRRHRVYSALLDRLTLSAAHADHLSVARGLSEESITRESFATVPDRAAGDRIAAELARDFDLENVPGFWRRYGQWVMRFAGISGFFIPIRDQVGRIQALQIRRDDAQKGKYLLFSSSDLPSGANSGAPAHYCNPNRAARGVVITEGALKANIVAEHLDACVVGLVAVGTFPESIGNRLISALGPIKAATIAYDSDWYRNPVILGQLLRLAHALENSKIAVKVALWDPAEGKGIDDYLLKNGGESWQ